MITNQKQNEEFVVQEMRANCLQSHRMPPDTGQRNVKNSQWNFSKFKLPIEDLANTEVKERGFAKFYQLN